MQPEDFVFMDTQFYYVVDNTWTTMFGQTVRLHPVPIQSLSELERARLQEVAFTHLEERELECKISIPRETRKRRKSLRRKFDSFSKEKKERETAPKAFGIPLAQVIANDRAHKQRQGALKESRRDCLDLEASVLRFRAEKNNQSFCSPDSAPSPSQELSCKPLSPMFLDNTSRVHRRGGLSVDSISDLVDSQSRLLEALQLSHPNELESKKVTGRANKLSINPIYRQVPKLVDCCCEHIETYGLQTVGIFRVGSSKKRVRELREEFDLGNDVILDDEHSVHDVAALLKEFLRHMPDPLLPRELYPAFLHANTLKGDEQLEILQQLIYLLPPCNCDTLQRLLQLLHTVQSYAEDTVGPDGELVPGNKMTATNLAVIFGPNLLQREKAAEKDHSLQMVDIEDSATIITITLRLIESYRTLFTVSAAMQQEVLMGLLQTDPDVIDYLLRRKLRGLDAASQSDSSARHCSSKTSHDSTTLSSEDYSPQDTSSVILDLDDSSLSNEVFFSFLSLNQQRQRPSEKSPRKPMNQTRQFHSYHNLSSLSDSSFGSRLEDWETFELKNERRFLRHKKQTSHTTSCQRGSPTGSSESQPASDFVSPSDNVCFSPLNYSQVTRNSPSPSPSSPIQILQHPSLGDKVFMKQDTPSTPDGKSQGSPTSFWDCFTGNISGSETIV
uniref:Rho GTPase activating protein 36 n=1 Tax=Lepisosteus oculatus TaxID=7918 RepID=W5NAV8_LEPOC|nr:PREDICTED: rho GTPase-activating protein 6-like isoform X2 [Lepisosteus oculatus]XP_015206755.1 PREDICTED: rho GTPase-activating protein 6-like isoform X2 [Lepisosteus oculatus]